MRRNFQLVRFSPDRAVWTALPRWTFIQLRQGEQRHSNMFRAFFRPLVWSSIFFLFFSCYFFLFYSWWSVVWFLICFKIFTFICYLHWCCTWTALLLANRNRVIFSCILLGSILGWCMTCILRTVRISNVVTRRNIMSFSFLYRALHLPSLFITIHDAFDIADPGSMLHRGQTSKAFFVLFSRILFNIKWKHRQGCIK